MLESAMVRRELERELISCARSGRPVSIELIVRDAVSLLPEAVRLQASTALDQLGLANVPITMLVEQQRCRACGWHGMPSRAQHACPTCGVRLAPITGRPIEVHARFGGRRVAKRHIDRRTERRTDPCR